MEALTHMHGGDLDAIERVYGIPKNEISDFSGNINPLGFPKPPLKNWLKIYLLFATIQTRSIWHLEKVLVLIQAQSLKILLSATVRPSLYLHLSNPSELKNE